MNKNRWIDLEEPHLSTKQAAKFLYITQSALLRHRKQNTGPVYLDINGIRRYPQECLINWQITQEK